MNPSSEKEFMKIITMRERNGNGMANKLVPTKLTGRIKSTIANFFSW